MKDPEKKIPEFRRGESWRYKRIKENWRKPKGIDNKMRLQLRGWPPIVKIGYRKSKKVRGLHPSGLQEVLVTSVKELENLDPSKHAVRLSGRLGLRKKLAILNEARKKGLRVLNAPSGVVAEK
ncbi:MAG: 50S ribosomal protein L32e [Nitrososphaeria archaeon]